jgi:1,4-dihydroxy-2-naphthoate octaprenyltransferase
MPAWLRAIRLPFLTATVVPVVLGSTAAWHAAGGFIWSRFWMALAGALLIHVGANLANEYGDHVTGNDAANLTPTPVSGGSRVIQEGLIAPRAILGASLASLALGASFGLYLNSLVQGNTVLALGVTGIFLGYFYSGAPLRLGYRGLGELAVAVGFGPLMVVGSYYVQVETLSSDAFLISAPVGILIALVLLINGFPDRDADRAVGKRTLVVILGKRRAVTLYHTLLVVAYASVAVPAALGALPPSTLVVLLSLPLAWRAYTVSKDSYERVDELLPASAATIGLHSLFGLLLALGLALDRLV